MTLYRFNIDGHDFETRIVDRRGNEVIVAVNGREYKAALQPRWTDLSEELALPPAAPAAPSGRAASRKPKSPARPPHAGLGVVTAPLPGLLLRVPVTLGDRVKRGQTVAVIAAMKMELSIGASIDGIVSSIAVEPGATVLGDEELVWIQAGEHLVANGEESGG
jgi:biotin carboxyl carrier protein